MRPRLAVRVGAPRPTIATGTDIRAALRAAPAIGLADPASDVRQSGKRTAARAGIGPIGHARLHRALWMPMLGAVRRNAWLRSFYERLRAAGKPAKLALIAAMRKLLCAICSVAKNRRPFTIATEQAREA